MRIIHVALAFLAVFITLPVNGAQLPGLPSSGNQAAGTKLDAPTTPLWLPIPKPSADTKAAAVTPAASAYAVIWQPECQQKIGLTTEQKKALREMNERRSAESRENFERNKALPPEELKAKAAEIQQRRQNFENDIRKEIEKVLTPEQLRALKEYAFPLYAIGLMQTPRIRQVLGFTPEQEENLSRLRKERWRRIQLENMKLAEKVWNLFTEEQQAELPELVKRQGPTSAVLSIAWELGLDIESMFPSYPMLAMAPARERLNLTTEQEEQLRAVMADAAKRIRAKLERVAEKSQPPAPEYGSEEDEKKRVEAILTPEQLKTIEEIDFRRKVVLALGYPEKRKTIHMTDKQGAELERLTKSQEMQEALYRMDQETSSEALKILTYRQKEQLREEIDKRGW
jgi:hypothetical protein